MEITLIRHGKPTFELRGNAQSKEIGDIVRNYNLSGITGEPPIASKHKVISCNVAVCSDFTRSIESAKALGFNNIHLTDPVFREVAMPYFAKGSFTMPVSAWSILFRSLSVFGFSNNGESLSMAIKRARIAALTLIEISQTHESVLLVGHGFMNYFIAKELLSRNWRGPSQPGRNYWEYGKYIYYATY